MKSVVVFILAVLTTEVLGGFIGITKEEVIPKVTVRLVRKTWHPKGFNPATDEPLSSFPGNYTELYPIIRGFSNRFGFVKERLINATKLFDNPNYNASQPSVIITHPMTIGDSLFIAYVVGALALRNLQKHYNIFAMHAPWLSLQFQTSCARVALGLDPLFKPVAEAFASFMLDGIRQGKMRPQQISFIGFSYAATLNAYIAREIRDNTGQLAHTLLTLDAFQHNHNNPYFKPVSREDAMFVHMFHSSSKLGGTVDRIGTVDIVLNNGFLQPGCNKDVNSGMGCSHRRSVIVFMFALVTSGNVVARQCGSWEEFSECKCSDPTHPLLVVSFPVNEQARGTYVFRTTSEFPFVLGIKGAYCEAEAYLPHKFK